VAFACFVLAFALGPVVPRGAAAVSGPASAVEPAGDVPIDPAVHRRDIEGWQRARDARLRSDTGWLTLAALYWLKPGENRFGIAADSDLVLPPRSGAPAHAGTFRLDGTQVTVDPAPGAAMALGGQPIARRVLKSDAGGAEPDILSLGSLTLQIIERQGRLAVRVKDRNSEVRRTFKGLTYFPIDSRFRVVARYTPHTPPRSISVPNVLGSDEALPSPGTVTFDLGGKSHHLDPVIEAPGDAQLFFIFRDQTSGRSTYGAGRFLYAEPPADLRQPGTVVLDFNKAYSPPCAFTPYATCPLPPPQNRLAIPVEAGEKFDPHAAHPGSPAAGE
jgi:uncharacterized protein (DUF1684 family)